MLGELEALYLALGAELGIVLRAEDSQRAKQRLYGARTKSGDPDLDCLKFHTSPYDENEIWITKDRIKRKAPSHANGGDQGGGVSDADLASVVPIRT